MKTKKLFLIILLGAIIWDTTPFRKYILGIDKMNFVCDEINLRYYYFIAGPYQSIRITPFNITYSRHLRCNGYIYNDPFFSLNRNNIIGSTIHKKCAERKREWESNKERDLCYYK